MFGPTFGAGDHIGCGIVYVRAGQDSKQDEQIIYFTRNGVKLPGIRLKQPNTTRFYPIVSMKGKLCHIEVI